MHEFGVSLRLGKMVCMVSMVNQSIWKGFRSMEQKLERFGLWLDNRKEKDDKIRRSRRSREIETYFATQGIHQGIKSHKLTI